MSDSTRVRTLTVGKRLALAFVVTSGLLGFVFSMIHHALYWQFPFMYPAVDYGRLIKKLQKNNIISEKFVQGKVRRRGRRRRESILIAWIILTKLWHERVKKNPNIEGANKRAELFADLVHSVGACRIALLAGFFTALVIVLDRATRGGVLLKLTDHVVTAIFTLLLAAILVICAHINYRQVHALARRFVSLVIQDALTRERHAGRWIP